MNTLINTLMNTLMNTLINTLMNTLMNTLIIMLMNTLMNAGAMLNRKQSFSYLPTNMGALSTRSPFHVNWMSISLG